MKCSKCNGTGRLSVRYACGCNNGENWPNGPTLVTRHAGMQPAMVSVTQIRNGKLVMMESKMLCGCLPGQEGISNLCADVECKDACKYGLTKHVSK